MSYDSFNISNRLQKERSNRKKERENSHSVSCELLKSRVLIESEQFKRDTLNSIKKKESEFFITVWHVCI